MTALFMVRAEVNDPGDWEAFDRWYEQEHLPQAAAAFQAIRAWRCWSELDPEIYIAFYEFPDLTAAQMVLDSDTLKGLIADFDRAWGTKVSRTRELVPTRQRITTSKSNRQICLTEPPSARMPKSAAPQRRSKLR